MNSLPPAFNTATFNTNAFSSGKYLTRQDADRLYLSTSYSTYINYNIGVTPGTITASKTVIVDSNKDISSFRNLTASTVNTNSLNSDGISLLGDLTSTNGRARMAGSAGIMYLQTSINTTTDNGCDFAIGNYTQTASTSSRVFMIKSTGLTGIQCYNPIKQLSINSATGQCLRLIYNNKAGTETNYCDLLVSSGGDLSITPSGGNVDITTHNGSTIGLKLGGTLITSTATQLNYNNVTPGTTTASKSIVTNASNQVDQININGEVRVGDLSSTAGRFQLLGYGGAGYIQSSTTNSTGNAADLIVANYGQDITASSRKFIIKSTGLLGIQTSNPQSQVSINSATGDCLRLVYNNSNGTETTSYTTMTQSSGGNFTISGSNADQIGSYCRVLRGLLVDSSLGGGNIIIRSDDVAGRQESILFTNNYATPSYTTVAGIYQHIGSSTNQGNLTFWTQNAASVGSYKEQVRISSIGDLTVINGKVGIGYTTPSYALDISSGSAVSYSIPSLTTYGFYEASTWGTTLGPYTFSASIRSANSIIVLSGGFETLSDRRVKENIKNIDLNGAIDFVKNVNGVQFNMKNHKETTIGYIAQDCLKYCPYVVSVRENLSLKGSILPDEPDGIQFTVDYDKVSVIQQVVIQDLLRRIEILEELTKK